MVSFFITARLAAQDTREAFTQVVLEQLADLLGQDLPPALDDRPRRGAPAGPAGPGRRCLHAKPGSGWYWWWTGWTRTAA